MNGISDNVSSTFIHFDFLRAISQAIGIPATKSMVATKRATAKEFWIAVSARDIRLDWLRTCCIVSHLITIPKIGGRKMRPRKIATATKYTPYLTLFFEERTSKISTIFGLGNFSLSAHV